MTSALGSSFFSSSFSSESESEEEESESESLLSESLESAFFTSAFSSSFFSPESESLSESDEDESESEEEEESALTAATGSSFFSSSAGGLESESESESLSLESESEEVAEEDSDLAGLAGSLFSSSFFSPLSESESEEDESESEDESEDAGAVLAFLAAGSSPESLSLSLSLSDSESDAASLRLIPLRGKALEEVSRSAKAMDATRRGGDAGTEGCCPAAAAAPISERMINISQPSASRAAGRGGSVTHLASMYTLAISTRSVLMACEVETGRRGQRGSHFAGRAPHPATAVAAEKNCDFRERFGRTHRLGRRHLLGARLGLERLEGGAQTVRLEVRLDGRDEVGSVRRGDGGHSVHGGRC